MCIRDSLRIHQPAGLATVFGQRDHFVDVQVRAVGISFAGCFSLQAGDVILTGTPVGVGPLNVGDELVLELPGVSSFNSSVR